jgi:hypothetical protein
MAAWQLRLIGAAAVRNAIREARVHLFPAKMKIRFARVAHRPPTNPIVKIEQAGFFGNNRAWPRRHKAARGRGGDRGLLVAGTLPQEPTGTN